MIGQSKTYIEVGYREVENLINKEFPEANGLFEITTDQECGNNTTLKFDINSELDKWDEEQLSDWKSDPDDNPGYLEVLLKDLCRRGIVAPGSYLIDVSW